jgi:nucleoside-diphosphate-sugar epimerase
MRKLIFGCGYLGYRVALRWRAEGADVMAVTRSSRRAAMLSSAGIEPIVADIMRPATMGSIPVADTLLYAVGFDRASGFSIHDVYVDGLRNVLRALPAGAGPLLYISSTGVYGQADGRWVDERSACEPMRAGGRACLEAERCLQEHPLGERTVILRMAGIYGPGRIPRREALEAGRPIAAPSEGYLNLIHVDDAAQAVLAAEKRAPRPALYCVADGAPVQRGAYYEHLAALLGAAKPRFEPPPSDSPVAMRAASSKRVSNERLIRELAVHLRYPSYREGLAAIVAAEPSGRSVPFPQAAGESSQQPEIHHRDGNHEGSDQSAHQEGADHHHPQRQEGGKRHPG